MQAPERFAVARDTARAVHDRQAEQSLRDLQAERIALQRQRHDFGGTLTDAEYTRRIEELEKAVKRKVPARADLHQRPGR